jgi:hypothetical protein
MGESGVGFELVAVKVQVEKGNCSDVDITLDPSVWAVVVSVITKIEDGIAPTSVVIVWSTCGGLYQHGNSSRRDLPYRRKKMA